MSVLVLVFIIAGLTSNLKAEFVDDQWIITAALV